ncbi:Mov34/MPN/PAD-1 family protein [Salinisphaera sp. P385]|uniref:Mov34/MPN/PAD-1 family protein n=1 Tax=Spectribacter acetivorans TaxID=3075603 RepID=A0ABU3B802_9GAMM|nr:Mov34/MPN/PAD-1 family protein [Salinisphaera sp. P385]MDT0618303.1 Mov34/MPN/PAD-1 family protein [Salinisphaera sp. P385]
MPGESLRAHAEHFLAVATRHPGCRAGRIIDAIKTSATVELDIDVELPLHMKPDGQSPNGVRNAETVQVVLGPSYPWSSPAFYLRTDFPRDLPHIQPDATDTLPRPCLLDGSQREFFFQFGMVEGGIFHLVDQLVIWLQHAAEGTLINREQGWEPTLRRDLANLMAIDAESCRTLVDRSGGHRIFRAGYIRLGAVDNRLSSGAAAMLHVSAERTRLKRADNDLFITRPGAESTLGSTVCCVVWPDKLPSGEQFIADTYLPETVTTLGALQNRANELRCGQNLRGMLEALERYFRGRALETPVPIGIVLCARRPFHLIGSASDIELLPYIVEVRATRGRNALFASGSDEPVAPATQLDVANPALLRNVSGAPETGSVAMLGCGSVGSKMAVHLARSGASITIASDQDLLMPHNLARHALTYCGPPRYKADALADELVRLGQEPQVHKGDLVQDLQSVGRRRGILTKQSTYAVNTTASLGVREALSLLAPQDVEPRLAEAALFGRGNGGFLLVEGKAHNPTLCDLVAELYATVDENRLRSLLCDPEHGLSEVQIGQGCSSLTMPMTDMRLSAMTAALTETLVEVMQHGDGNGEIAVGHTAENAPDTGWSRRSVAPFHVIPIQSTPGWTMRVSQRVLDQMRAEAKRWPASETGGVLIGKCSVRLKAVTVVDLLPAPPDSVRSETLFTLGTNGLKQAIIARHRATGGALFDVGTWHSHLDDHGPSARDWETARELGSGRPPPSVLLIVTPERLHAIMHAEGNCGP